MSKRRKGEKPVIVERPTRELLAEQFVVAGKRIVLGAGLLDAYRKGTGLCFRTIRTAEAQQSLKAAQDYVIARFDWILSVTAAYEHAGRMAMCEYLGKWWTTTLHREPPPDMGEGDEFYSIERVRERIEG